MKVLFAAGEVWPFVKTGGLGDVAYSLPKALKKEKIDVLIGGTAVKFVEGKIEI